MHFHYALVDDLFDRDEFARRVEEKIEEAGGLLAECTAAMLVVREAGREHRKINSLDSATSLISFFAKVLSVTPPKEFKRDDGSPGCVARLRAGDETGEITVLLWDDQAAAVTELEPGEVLEIVGRPRQGRALEVHAMAMRRTACEICIPEERRDNGARPEPETLEVRILSVGEVRAFQRRDGSPGAMSEAIIGDAGGTARLVCWEPEVLGAVSPGDSVRISGLRRNTRSQRREYSIGEEASILPIEEEIAVPFTTIDEIAENGVYSLSAKVTDPGRPRSFTTRKGDASWVRNAAAADGTGTIRLVFWGDAALMHLAAGDKIEVYNAAAKRGRNGFLELHAGFGSAVRLVGGAEKQVVITGTVMETVYGRCIDDGVHCWLLDGDLPLGLEFRVRGRLTGRRLSVEAFEPVAIDQEALRRRLDRLLSD